jgi:hypothetical protein
LIERVTNRTRYAVDVTSGGRSSAMSRKDVGDDLCHLEPLPRFDFRPVIANGSFTSRRDVAPCLKCTNTSHSPEGLTLAHGDVTTVES